MCGRERDWFGSERSIEESAMTFRDVLQVLCRDKLGVAVGCSARGTFVICSWGCPLSYLRAVKVCSLVGRSRNERDGKL